MTFEVNSYPAGIRTSIYVTSDGGCNLTYLEQHVPLLGGHVQVSLSLSVCTFCTCSVFTLYIKQIWDLTPQIYQSVKKFSDK